ncbi:hypothetical protein [Sphingobium sp.]|uniref:hypothetical protein n=1 Tax=Sphingobium sp. TaxID=1912891 RepID=UPI0026125DF1|nr:hypothetical protein [Sphingobium sp.]
MRTDRRHRPHSHRQHAHGLFHTRAPANCKDSAVAVGIVYHALSLQRYDLPSADAFGWGGIEAGVTTDSAQAASGLKIRDDGHYTEAGDGTCPAYEVIGGPQNLQMLVESGLVTTVEAYLDPPAPTFMTDRGVKLGDPEATVRKAPRESQRSMPSNSMFRRVAPSSWQAGPRVTLWQPYRPTDSPSGT